MIYKDPKRNRTPKPGWAQGASAPLRRRPRPTQRPEGRRRPQLADDSGLWSGRPSPKRGNRPLNRVQKPAGSRTNTGAPMVRPNTGMKDSSPPPARTRPQSSPSLNRTPKPVSGPSSMQGQGGRSPLARTIRRPKRKQDDMMAGNEAGRIRRPRMPAQQAAPGNNRLGARVPAPTTARPRAQRPYGGQGQTPRPQMAGNEAGMSAGREAMRRRMPKARSAAMPKRSMM